MQKYAVTGNIGSGKSTICKVFESLGIPIYYADKEAKKFYLDTAVIEAVKKLFGDDVFNSNDQLISSILAERAFRNQDKLTQLNAIIHPLVMDDLKKWELSHSGEDYLIYESALLFESGFHTLFDKIILVTAPLELALKRVVSRDGTSPEDFLSRRAAQWDESKKIELADIIITNDESQPLIPRIIELHSRLSSF